MSCVCEVRVEDCSFGHARHDGGRQQKKAKLNTKRAHSLLSPRSTFVEGKVEVPMKLLSSLPPYAKACNRRGKDDCN
jgi:hypothetical protein